MLDQILRWVTVGIILYTMLGVLSMVKHLREWIKVRKSASFVLIRDVYNFMDRYGTVYEPGDYRGEKQQALFDRMVEILTQGGTAGEQTQEGGV